MSILIKGMEMPKDYSVIVKIFPDGRVGTIPYVQWFKVDLIPGTQAVPVPPHGRLIDKDALLVDTDEGVIMREENGEMVEVFGEEKILAHIAFAPTIIPADKEGEA